MTAPTTAQLHHLADRARRGVALDAEHDQLAAGITAMDAQLEQAELDAEQQARHFHTVCGERESYRQAWKYEQKRRAVAEAAIERVRQLHHEDDYDSCPVCETRSTPLAWPCPTIRALDEQQPTTTEA